MVDVFAREHAGHKEVPTALSGKYQLRLSTQPVGVASSWHNQQRSSSGNDSHRCFRAVRANAHGARSIAGAAVLAVVVLSLWLFRFTPEWVRVPAEAYAARLVKTVDLMGSKAAAIKA